MPVFPGAVGFGVHTPAGRGGKVIEVTTLADGGPGSLREALLDPAPRVIVFRVGGTIRLKEALYIHHPFVTVAGQTAPGDGVLIRDFGLTLLTHDVLVQHLRFRPGDQGSVKGEDNDGIGVLGKAYGGDVHHVVLDHLSVSWAEDENVSVLGGARDVTVSHCLIAEGLNRSRHGKKTHSTGLLVDDAETATVYRCLLAHNGFRNPVFLNNHEKRKVLAEMVESAVYNWGDLATEATDYTGDAAEGLRLNLVDNLYRPGPDRNPDFPFPIAVGREGRPRLHLRGNRLYPEGPFDEELVAGIDFPLAKEGLLAPAPFPTPATQNRPSRPPDWEDRLRNVGATRPRRDAVDRRILEEARTGAGRIIDRPEDVGGYPDLAGGTPPIDTDRDGMPDDWESGQGLNPRDPADGNDDRNGDGYTNLENYLFTLL